MRSNRSFTLVELVFVMAILGILLAASVPRFAQTSERLRLEQTAFQLAQMLRYAHERAVAEGREIVWQWDESGHRAQLYVMQDDGLHSLEERFAMSPPLPPWVSVSLERTGDAAVTGIGFLQDGTSEHTTITVAHGKEHYVVTVDATTGQAVLSARTPPR